ncbi:TrbG/VirB9 family P-type conjugative transfer protein [Telmatospirillum siberiense]|uniref:Conjugal transfer protein TrbG n=1 Tax=Telmatospirillum siberiense TaxID=382514 RepID=A0A2N3PQZ2_9PROT|nr:TrbG/VirB9 family P-type conjugative transfer protein [Telmatospirillum siberiense]PKU22818.1 hypothetical protein CWS72_19370 [Telmatospirillum siberiense]
MKTFAISAGCGVLLLMVSSSLGLAQNTVPTVPLPTAARGVTATTSGAATGSAPPAARNQQAVPPQFLSSTETAIDQQTRGQFPTMDRSPSLPLGTLQRSWDRPSAAAGQTAPGVIHYMWHSDFVMSVRTRDFMVTTLILPAWEKANEFYLGDPVVFEAKKVRGNVVAVRSRNAGADSNLTVLGATGNVYNFYLRSETWNSSQVTDLTVYVDAPRNGDDMDGIGIGTSAGSGPAADDAPGYGAVAGMPDYLRRIVFRPEDLRFDMKMYARSETDADIAPERIFEDGIFTYFDFGERSDSIARPVVHHLVDGVDTAVNTRTAGPRGSVLIAEAVGDFTLRNGNRVICVRRAAVKQTLTPLEISGTLPEAGGGGSRSASRGGDAAGASSGAGAW